ncbi:RNA polymerase sigma factor [Nostoc sp. 'Peltigera membranacea cyanobiont' N6]|nr:RNA polymerase sigma factor [Nostoc sp. 'Peltigera membranacea cyanobiont' N6]
MTNAKNKCFPEVIQVLESQQLKNHIRYRLRVLSITFISEDDVINYACMCLVETLNSSKQVIYPIAWARSVSNRYINYQYKKHKMSRATESDKIEYLANRCNQEFTSCDDDKEIFQKIQKLNLTDQKLIIMRFFEKFSWKNIALHLSQQEGKTISDATARKRGERAIDRLREKYIDESIN